jgi:hypothetical protein
LLTLVDTSRQRALLKRAGVRASGQLRWWYPLCAASALSWAVLAVVCTIEWCATLPAYLALAADISTGVVAIAVGWQLPDWILHAIVQRYERRLLIELSWLGERVPLALICGHSLSQSLRRAAEHSTSPRIALRLFELLISPAAEAVSAPPEARAWTRWVRAAAKASAPRTLLDQIRHLPLASSPSPSGAAYDVLSVSAEPSHHVFETTSKSYYNNM